MKEYISIKKQNSVSEKELFDLIDMIACSHAFALKYRKHAKVWYEHAEELTYRLIYVKSITLYRFVPDLFLCKIIARETKKILKEMERLI